MTIFSPVERRILERYFDDLSGLPKRHEGKDRADILLTMKKVHSRWKEGAFGGRSEEFLSAAKTILETCHGILKGEVTLKDASEKCRPFWQEKTDA